MSLPNGWIQTELKTVGKIVTGKTPSKKNSEYYGGNCLLVKPGDLDKEVIVLDTQDKLTELGLDNAPAIPIGSVMVTCIGNMGKVGIAGEKLATNQQINSIVPDKKIIESRFLYYYAKTLKSWLDMESSATTISIINKSKFSTAPVLLPPLNEQKRIAKKLDELLATVESIKTRLDNAPTIIKRFRQSILSAATSGDLTSEWREENKNILFSGIKLKQLVYKKRQENWAKNKIQEFKEKGKTQKNDKWKEKYKVPDEAILNNSLPKEWTTICIDAISQVTKLAGFEYTEYVTYTEVGDLPVLKAENVGKFGFRKKKFSFVDSKSVEMLKRSELFGNEVLMVFVGAGTGQVGMVPNDKKYFLGPNIAVIKNDKSLCYEKYLEHYLRSPLGVENILLHSKGAAQPSLSMTSIRKIFVNFPSYDEQKEIVSQVESLFALADTLEEKIELAKKRVDKLTQSILAKAFRGELVEQDPNDESAEKLLERIRNFA